jgi:4-hydroxythreonine-4-phosphate dehydrogenase
MRSSNIADRRPGAAAPIAVSMGDPAGIGPEIIAKAWAARDTHALPPFVAVGDARAVARVWPGPIARIGDLAEGDAAFAEALPVMTVEDAGEIVPGLPDIEGARCALHSLELAVGLVRTGAARALVTGPVSKAQLYAIGFSHPGQTEFVAERYGIAGENAVMMLAGPSLRVVPITTHVPLAQVSSLLSIELIVAKGRATARGLTKNFGIESPRILEPAIAILQAEGIDAAGPFAADTLFHPRARATYDACLCCYHDQALVPLKTLHFDEGVNMTLGLPIVRTSPDHGTAFGIAGKDIAEPGAMIAAIAMAGSAADRRATIKS